MYLVSPDLQLASLGLSVSAEEMVDKAKDLLHHGVLPQVIITLMAVRNSAKQNVIS